MGHTPLKERAEQIATRVATRSQHLRCEVDDSPRSVEFIAKFPVQAGLRFPVGMHLDGDVLGLYAGEAYHQDFFPASDDRVVSEFETYFAGLLSGDCRVVEYFRGDRPAHKARLEQRVADIWQTRSTWSRLHIPFLPHATRTLHNV